MKKTLVRVASVVVTGIICKGLLVKAVRRLLKDELAKMEEDKSMGRDIPMDKEQIKDKTIDNLIFDTRETAEIVVDNMQDLIDKYGAVTVADINDLAGITNVLSDQLYGWTDVNACYIIRTINGWSLILPAPIEIEK